MKQLRSHSSMFIGILSFISTLLDLSRTDSKRNMSIITPLSSMVHGILFLNIKGRGKRVDKYEPVLYKTELIPLGVGLVRFGEKHKVYYPRGVQVCSWRLVCSAS
jgi:hypothetical protein